MKQFNWKLIKFNFKSDKLTKMIKYMIIRI